MRKEFEMEPIRILNLFTILNRGGAETMVMNYYRHIDRTKVQFDFMVHRQERGAYEDEIEAMGGKIYRMIPIFPQNIFKYKKMLRDFFRKHKEYEIIHSHMSELGYYAFVEAEKQGIPIRICHAHSAPRLSDFDLKMIVRENFKYRMRPYMTHMFTCAVDSGLWLYGRKNIKKFIMMNNAVDAKQLSYNDKVSTEIKKILNIERKFVIGHIGRFERAKNHNFLIDIFYNIYKLNPESALILVGEGSLEDKIKNKVGKLGIDNAVKFLGVRADIEKIIQAFDVFLFPSLYEGLGIALIEAQAAGLHCITSDRVVPQETKITELLEYVSLKSDAEFWANKTLQYNDGYERKDTYDEVVKSGYDINHNVKWLENFYLDEYRKTAEKVNRSII